jgi:integrase/recombinase XerD
MAIPNDIREGFTQWLHYLQGKNYSPRTISSYTSRIKYILERVPSLDHFALEDYLIERARQGLSASSQRQDYKALQSFLRYLVHREILAKNPLAEIEAPETVERTREPATQEAIDKLLEACATQDYSGKMKLMLLILIDTGARVFEATEIKLADINLEEAEIQLFGKARPRHGPRPRTVPISPITVKTLRAYIRDVQPAFLKVYGGNPDYLFPNNNKFGHWRPGEVRSILSRMCRRIGIKSVTPHMIRHFTATEMLNRGAEMRLVSRLLGHSNVGITDKIYGHVEAAQVKESHRKFSPLADHRES